MCEDCKNEVLLDEVEFEDVDVITFSKTNYATNERDSIEFNCDGTIEYMVIKFRAFLLSQTFVEATVDEWVANPYDLSEEYSYDGNRFEEIAERILKG